MKKKKVKAIENNRGNDFEMMDLSFIYAICKLEFAIEI